MDRKPALMKAATRALTALEIQNAQVDDAIQHTATHDLDLDKWSVHFREDGGRYFRVVVDTRQVLLRYGHIGEDSFTQEIYELLQKRDPTEYMS